MSDDIKGLAWVLFCIFVIAATGFMVGWSRGWQDRENLQQKFNCRDAHVDQPLGMIDRECVKLLIK